MAQRYYIKRLPLYNFEIVANFLKTKVACVKNDIYIYLINFLRFVNSHALQNKIKDDGKT
jgi:hypothetical protein